MHKFIKIRSLNITYNLYKRPFAIYFATEENRIDFLRFVEIRNPIRWNSVAERYYTFPSPTHIDTHTHPLSTQQKVLGKENVPPSSHTRMHSTLFFRRQSRIKRHLSRHFLKFVGLIAPRATEIRKMETCGGLEFVFRIVYPRFSLAAPNYTPPRPVPFKVCSSFSFFSHALWRILKTLTSIVSSNVFKPCMFRRYYLRKIVKIIEKERLQLVQGDALFVIINQGNLNNF